MILFFLALIVIAFGLMNVQQDIKPEVLRAQYENPRSKFIRIFNQDVHYTDDGVGKTLVLLHGVGESLDIWNDVVGELSKHFRVVTVTLPGHGLTGPAPREDYSIKAYTAFLDAFMKQLGIQRANLVGFSLGGYIAWSYAAQYPQNVAKLILISSGGYPASYRLPISFIAEVPYLNRLLLYVTPKLFVRLMLTLAYLPQIEFVTSDLVKRYYDLNHLRGNRAAMIQILRTLNHADASALKSIRVPTMVLWGGDDRVLPVHYAQRFESDLKGSRLTIYKGIGHCLVDLVPRDLVSDIRKFVAPDLFR
jgi:pimeloyl-ACP methyl ester carboxylesterase